MQREDRETREEEASRRRCAAQHNGRRMDQRHGGDHTLWPENKFNNRTAVDAIAPREYGRVSSQHSLGTCPSPILSATQEARSNKRRRDATMKTLTSIAGGRDEIETIAFGEAQRECEGKMRPCPGRDVSIRGRRRVGKNEKYSKLVSKQTSPGTASCHLRPGISTLRRDFLGVPANERRRAAHGVD